MASPGVSLRVPPGVVALDLRASDAAKTDGMARAEAHAPAGWIEQAVEKIRLVALRQALLTSDDVWTEGLSHPHEARALGPCFTRARALGFVEPTDQFVLTAQVKRHRAPVRVWKSLLFGWTKERVMKHARRR